MGSRSTSIPIARAALVGTTSGSRTAAAMAAGWRRSISGRASTPLSMNTAWRSHRKRTRCISPPIDLAKMISIRAIQTRGRRLSAKTSISAIMTFIKHKSPMLVCWRQSRSTRSTRGGTKARPRSVRSTIICISPPIGTAARVGLTSTGRANCAGVTNRRPTWGERSTHLPMSSIRRFRWGATSCTSRRIGRLRKARRRRPIHLQQILLPQGRHNKRMMMTTTSTARPRARSSSKRTSPRQASTGRPWRLGSCCRFCCYCCSCLHCPPGVWPTVIGCES